MRDFRRKKRYETKPVIPMTRYWKCVECNNQLMYQTSKCIYCGGEVVEEKTKTGAWTK